MVHVTGIEETTDIEAMRDDSHSLLGGRYRLEVAAAVGSLPDEFSNSDVLAAAGWASEDGQVSTVFSNAVTQNLQALAKGGVVERVGSRGRWRRMPSAYWSFVGQLNAEIGSRHTVPALRSATRSKRRGSD